MIDPQRPDFTSTPIDPRRAIARRECVRLDGQPIVTVVTPFFNVGKVFFETARSIFNQTLQQWEWLIVNDASDSAEGLKTLEEVRNWNDPRVRVIDLPRNVGPGARNAGFEAARAKLVFPLDADDLIEPATLEKLAWFLASYPEYSFVNSYTVGFGAQEYLWTHGFHERDAFLNENLVGTFTMIRRDAHQKIGGFDESIRGGFEDWDYWLRMAGAGMWGATIPEYLTWYRRRPHHGDRWQDWDAGHKQKQFTLEQSAKYAHLTASGWPDVHPAWHVPYAEIGHETLGANELKRTGKRLLIIVPWFTMGGSDKFTIDLVQQLAARGWDITLVSTKQGQFSWAPEFAKFTEDLFILPNFLKLSDYPRFLRYLIDSRQADVVMITNSDIGYLLLPYLKAHCPQAAYVDYCHMEEEYWKNGGYPRFAAGAQPMLDLNIVSSNHVKDWMASRGADAARVEVAYTNINSELWKRDETKRQELRALHGIEGDTPVILYAGRIMSQKQPRVFAETMRQLHARGLQFVTLVAGDGPDMGFLRNFVSEYGMERHVRLLGAVPNAAVRELMSACDIFFLPSLQEGIALAIFEAMSMELTVVGAVVGGQIELVTPECGILLERGKEAGEAAQYAEALAGLIGDSKRCRAMAERSRARIVNEFVLEQMGDRMHGLLERAISFHREAPRAGIDPGLGDELARRAIEQIRLEELSEFLWAKAHAPAKQQSDASESVPNAIKWQMQVSADRELGIVENCPSWRFYLRLQGSSIGGVLRRAGLLKRWDDNADETSSQRLERILKSSYFQRVMRMRNSWPYRAMQKARMYLRA